jgi:hypothetical protein
MKAAAFVYLPVQPRRLSVKALHAVHSQIVLTGRRMLRVDEREREERPAVFLPRRQDRQFIKSRRLVHHLRDGSAPGVACAELQSFKSKETMLPELCGAGRKESFSDMHDLSHKSLRLRAEGKLNTPRCAEEISDYGVAAALDAIEKQRGASALDHSAMDFGEFEVGVNFRFDSYEIVFAFEQV